MTDASSIRAGGAHVEISADDAPMLRRLRATQARLRQWAAENSGAMQISRGTEGALRGEGKGFLSGGFRGMQLFDTGLKLATAVMSMKVGMKDLQIASALTQVMQFKKFCPVFRAGNPPGGLTARGRRPKVDVVTTSPID